MTSVVIPAHNEEAVIGRCLSRLLAGFGPGDIEVVVACNGCRDRTAAVARAAGPMVRVIELAEASKTAALNAGDAAASGFPRFFIDADVVIERDAILKTAAALEGGETLVAAPVVRVDTTDRSRGVRAFYRVWSSLPYATNGRMVGSGVYAVSERGRSRFESFPRIIADDAFIRLTFAPHERLTVPGCCFTVSPPRTLMGIVKIKTRSRFGNQELRDRFPAMAVNEDCSAGAALRSLLMRPGVWPSVPIFAYVSARTRVNAWRKRARDDRHTWERDDTSRWLA